MALDPAIADERARLREKVSRVLIFGNSGSGKSTLADALSRQHQLAHLDLDTLAWQTGDPPERMPLAASQSQISSFLDDNAGWVVEGCYSDLIEFVLPAAEHLIYLDLPIEECIANARRRPWEPHKYATKADQDANLDMLIDWIAKYAQRSDVFSRAAHQDLFVRFPGSKARYRSNRHGQ